MSGDKLAALTTFMKEQAQDYAAGNAGKEELRARKKEILGGELMRKKTTMKKEPAPESRTEVRWHLMEPPLYILFIFCSPL